MPPTLEVTQVPHRSAAALNGATPAGASTARGQPTAAMPRTAVIGLTLLIVSLWILVHPYAGIVDDAVFYALAALARLHPQSLAHDVFLGPGSQDHYTIFSPIVAAVIRAMGLGRAAALITAAGQAALYCSAALLARRLVPHRLAILSVALLVVLPSLYGAYHIFAYTEDFMTSRVPAEALVLASLAATLDRRYVIAGLCVAGAMLLHPLTGLAAFVMIFVLISGWRTWRIAGLAVAAVAASSLLAWWMPFWRIVRIDGTWFALLHWRTSYAFPTLWTLNDWGSTAVPLATLLAGAAGSSSPVVRSFCRAGLITGVCGILATVLGQDLLRILLITQIQPWRWLWLSGALAVLVLPAIAADYWRAGDLGRAALLLLAASWISYYQNFVLVIAVFAIIAVSMRNFAIEPHRARRLLIGSWTILALSSIVFLGLALFDLTHQPAVAPGPTWLRSAIWVVAHRVRPWVVGGVIPAALVSALWWLAAHRSDRRAHLAVLALGVLSCCAVAPYAWQSWGNPQPSAAIRAEFASWRRQIPPTAQVLVSKVPVIPWFLLDRPSYWSIRQMAGIAFSRPTAMELLRRLYIVRRFRQSARGPSALRRLCTSDPLIGFVVARSSMGQSPFAPVTLDSEGAPERLYLYRCADYRTDAESGPFPTPQRRE